MPNFSDPEDFHDEISNEDLLPELMAQEPRLDEAHDRIICIDNIPKVGTDKKDKLKKLMGNLLTQYGKIVNEFYPEGDDAVLKGYMFVEYENSAAATEAIAQLNGYRLDKAHSFKVNYVADFDGTNDKNNKNDEQGELPVPYKNPGNLQWYLTNPDAYDQFCVLHNDMFTSVFLNTRNQPTVLKSREKWTETRFQWSPKGTYLATFHERGIALWAGEEFIQFARFAHNGVQLIDFSPSENYLVTCNPNRAGVDDQALIIWCVRSGQKKRSFTCERSVTLLWPNFKWNFDDKYFARLSTDSLLVYETQTFTLLDKKSIKIPHIVDFEWSPTNNYLSYWVAEHKNVPARVVLLEIPTKTEIRYKNLVNVVECKMHWQNAGDYMCVQVERYRKVNFVRDETTDRETPRYSGTYYNFEFFRIREKQIPVDSIEIKDANAVLQCFSFAWEPFGQRAVVIYGETSGRTTAAFYRISPGTGTLAGKLELIKEFKPRACLQISWAPQGQYVVLGTSKRQQATSCHLEFYDTGSANSNDIVMLNKVEHENMTDYEWDPTGRYFVSYVSYWNHRFENAYIMYNFQGKQMQKQAYEKLYKFSWRPRPQSLLSADQIKEIKKNLKQYTAKYDVVDIARNKIVSQELLEKRRKMMDEFTAFRRNAARRQNEHRQRRLELRNGQDTDKLNQEVEEIEYTVQLLVETKKEEVNE